MTDPIYRGEAWLKRWSDSSNAGRTITLQIDEDGTHPFKGYEGERFAIVIMLIGNDEKPMEKAPKPETPQSKGGVARAEKLSPERRTEIAQTAAKKRWHELRPSARAAMLTQDEEFQAYLKTALAMPWSVYENGTNSDTTVADIVLKEYLHIGSKKELDEGPLVHRQMLQDLEGNFRAWQQARGHGYAA